MRAHSIFNEFELKIEKKCNKKRRNSNRLVLSVFKESTKLILHSSLVRKRNKKQTKISEF